MKKIILAIAAFGACIYAGEPNRASLTDIKEAAALLIKENREQKQALEAANSKIQAAERNITNLRFQESQIKKNTYMAPSPYDNQILNFIGQ